MFQSTYDSIYIPSTKFVETSNGPFLRPVFKISKQLDGFQGPFLEKKQQFTWIFLRSITIEGHPQTSTIYIIFTSPYFFQHPGKWG